MKTHPDPVCIVLWLNETSVFLLTRSSKRVIGTTGSEIPNCTPYFVYSGL